MKKEGEEARRGEAKLHTIVIPWNSEYSSLLDGRAIRTAMTCKAKRAVTLFEQWWNEREVWIFESRSTCLARENLS